MRYIAALAAALLAGMLSAAALGFLSLFLLWIDAFAPVPAVLGWLNSQAMLQFGALGLGAVTAVLVFRLVAFPDR